MKYVWLSLLVFYSARLFAQVGYGPEVGLGMSSMHFAPDVGFTSATTNPIFSFKVGGIVDYGINKHVYLQGGVFLSQRGQNRSFSFYSSDSLNAAVDQTLTIDYIDVPVNVLVKTGFQRKGRFICGLGVMPSYIVAGTNKAANHGMDSGVAFANSMSQSILKNTPVAKFDLGVTMTMGYELPTGLFFKLYYTAGIQDIGLGTEVDKNRMWGIAAGYIFGKGRNINKEADDLIDRSPD